MNFKNKSFIKYIAISFSFLCALLFLGTSKVKAGSTDFYFPNQALAIDYTNEGKAVYTNNLEVCAVNNDAGYQIDQKKLRISQVIITQEKDYVFDIDEHSANFVTYVNIQTKTTCTNSASATSSRTDKITLNLAGILNTLGFNDDANYSSLNIKFKLSIPKVFIIQTGWKDYTSVKFYKAGTSSAQSYISYKKTDISLLKDKFTYNLTASVKNSKCGTVDGVLCYSSADREWPNENNLTLNVTFPFKVKNAENVKLKYTDGTQQKNLDLNTLNTSKNGITKNIKSDESFLEGEHLYTFKGISARITDIYGTNLIIDKSISERKVIVDTKGPEITTAGVYNSGSQTQLGLVDVKIKFVASEAFKIIKVKSFGYTINGGQEQFSTQEYTIDNSNNNSTSQVKEFTCNLWVTGKGAIKLTSFKIELTDIYGNKFIHESNINDNAGIFNNNILNLDTNISSITLDKNYYYNEDANIEIQLVNNTQENALYSKIELINPNNGITEVFDVSLNDSKLTATIACASSCSYSKIRLYKLVEVEQGTNIKKEIVEHEETINLNFNVYLPIGISEQYVYPGNKNLNILPNNSAGYKYSDFTFDSNKVTYTGNINQNQFSCLKENGQINCKASEGINKDIVVEVTIAKNAIAINDDNYKGYTNEEIKFTYIYNYSKPLIIKEEYPQTYKIGNDYYFTSDEAGISLNYEDQYAISLCTHYTITYNLSNQGNIVKDNNVQCGLDKDNRGIFSYNIKSIYDSETLKPKNGDKFIISYYVSDGQNSLDRKTVTFIYKDFLVDDINLKINDKETILDTDWFNYFKIDYNELNKGLLNSISVSTNIKGDTILSCSLLSTSCNKDNLILNINETITFTITLEDKLYNTKSLIYKINIDTLNPTFDEIVVNKVEISTGYRITITNNSEFELVLKVDGNVVASNNNQYILDKSVDVYTIELKDEAGNISVQEFLTKLPIAELLAIKDNYNVDSIYELYIYSYDSVHHTINDTINYLIFEYGSEVSDEDIIEARKFPCSEGKTTVCYKTVGAYDFKEVGTHTITKKLTFTRGYTYLIELEANEQLIKDENEAMLRLDISPLDEISPDASFFENDVNPSVISSKSDKVFTYSFKANDENLSEEFLYLVVDSSVSITNLSEFNEMYYTCYGDDFKVNRCGINGSGKYVVNNGVNVATIELNTPANKVDLSRRLVQGEFKLYALLLDKFNNPTVFLVRTFQNIINPKLIEYCTPTVGSNNCDDYLSLENKAEVTTENSAKVRIVKGSNNMSIEKVLVNDTVQNNCSNGCIIELAVDKYVIKVYDELGNESIATIYSGYTGRPKVNVYYKYNETDYLPILDTTLSYNSSKVDNVYIRVVNENIESIQVVMGAINKTYTSGDIFTALTPGSGYGMQLSQLINLHYKDVYSGLITIVVKNNTGKINEVKLDVDNDNPIITLTQTGKVELEGTLNDLTYSNGKYHLTYNYNRKITYMGLMRALSLKVDGIDFDTIIDINRFRFEVDSIKFSNTDESISNDYTNIVPKGSKNIVINYFDAAGNEATPVTIVINVIDNEAPSIIGLDSIVLVELNTEIDLISKIIVEDNHDKLDKYDVEVTLAGEVINGENYKFVEIKEYEVEYRVSDNSSNYLIFKQTIHVQDTTPPKLEGELIDNYKIGVNQEKSIALPKFKDNSSDELLYASNYELRDSKGNLLEKNSNSYPINIDTSNSLIKVKFDETHQLGKYYLLISLSDSSFNKFEVVITFELEDITPPEIKVELNGVKVNNGSVTTISLKHEVRLIARAYDEIEGELDNLVRTITFNDKVVDEVDTSISGTYLIKYVAKDSEDNVTTFEFTIIVDVDNTNPIIQEVKINGVKLEENIRNKVSNSELVIDVIASDNSLVNVSFNLLGYTYSNWNNGESIIIDNTISGEICEIVIKVNDLSLNETVITYQLLIDNVAPDINGVKNNYIYHQLVNLNISDYDLDFVKLYKDGELIAEHTEDVIELEIKDKGVYKVEAKDNHGNVATKLFIITEESKYIIVDDNDNIVEYEYDYSQLIEVRVVDGNMVLILDKEDIKSQDEIHILVNYPDSNRKYIIYSFDGETYLDNETITLEPIQINGVVNEKLLKKIDDKYYAYMIILEAENDGTNVDNTETKDNGVLKSILTTVLVIVGVVSLAILFIKLRRRVRAI